MIEVSDLGHSGQEYFTEEKDYAVIQNMRSTVAGFENTFFPSFTLLGKKGKYLRK